MLSTRSVAAACSAVVRGLTPTLRPLPAMACKLFSQDDSQLIVDLHSLQKSPKLVKLMYYDIPSPFPTLARGLFSGKEENAEEKDSRVRHQIIARGYDKFFNIGEVPWTTVRFSLAFLPIVPTSLTPLSFCQWSSLESHTKPPYTLTLKSNGCIIFIADRRTLSIEASCHVKALYRACSGRS
jgi:tRNA ligase